MMYSAYKLNKRGDNIRPWRNPFPIWNQSVVPCTYIYIYIYIYMYSMCVCATYICICASRCGDLPSGSVVKNLPAVQEPWEMRVWSLGQEEPLEEGMVTHTGILAWRIPWTEEPYVLQSIQSQRVRHDWSDLALGTHLPRCICSKFLEVE